MSAAFIGMTNICLTTNTTRRQESVCFSQHKQDLF